MTRTDQEKWTEILTAHGGNKEEATETYIKYKCLTDLFFLGSKILGLQDAEEGKRSRFDPTFHRWLAGKMGTDKDTMIIVPRGHMKSTWAKIRVVQLLLQNPLRRIALISRTSGLVEEQLNDIRQLLMKPLLRRYFSDLIPEPGRRFNNWLRSTMNELTMIRLPEWGRIPQENQIEAWGLGATITGRHYDVIVLDDPINEQSCSTPEQIQKARDFFSYLQAILEPDGFLLVIGTRYHHADLFGTIIKNGWFGRRVYVREAIEKGRPIYRFFTKKMLMRIKSRVGPFVWSCQYMNNPIPQEFQIFPPPQPVYSVLPSDEYDYFITVDPAATTEVYSDDTAIVVTAVNKLAQMYVVEALPLKKPGNIIAEKLVELIVKYRPRKVGIEWGLQTSLRFIIDSKVRDYTERTGDTIGVAFEAIKIPRNMSKAERINRSLGSFVRDSKLFIRQDMEQLMLQMEYFPRGEHDDLVDALDMQLQLIDSFKGTYWVQQIENKPSKATFYDMFGDLDGDKGPRGWEDQFVS